jgi:hypothetical protein
LKNSPDFKLVKKNGFQNVIKNKHLFKEPVQFLNGTTKLDRFTTSKIVFIALFQLSGIFEPK